MLAKPLAACTYLSSIVSELYDAEVNAQVQKLLFFHIFVSPGDAPGAITLNVVWMEREFDAYKLFRCMCPLLPFTQWRNVHSVDFLANSKCFWDRARYLWKNHHFIIPSCIRCPRQYGKSREVSLPNGEKISKICLYVSTWSTNVTWRTDRHCMTAKTGLASHRIER